MDDRQQKATPGGRTAWAAVLAVEAGLGLALAGIVAGQGALAAAGGGWGAATGGCLLAQHAAARAGRRDLALFCGTIGSSLATMALLPTLLVAGLMLLVSPLYFLFNGTDMTADGPQSWTAPLTFLLLVASLGGWVGAIGGATLLRGGGDAHPIGRSRPWRAVMACLLLLGQAGFLVAWGITPPDWLPLSVGNDPYRPVLGRDGASATALADGRILVAGGLGRFGDSAFIFDPVANTWAQTGALPTPRAYHTATRLADGRILVVGGDDPAAPGSALASADLYDPATGRWSPTGDLAGPRNQHRAILLAGGDVAVFGGQADTYHPLSRLELYDPAKGGWRGSAAPGHYWSASALPIALVDGDFLALDLENRAAARYSPAIDRWRQVSVPTAWSGGVAAVVLADGRVLVVGGATRSGGPITNYHTSARDDAAFYDPVADRWEATGPLGSARIAPTLTLLPDGTALAVSGGGGGYRELQSAERFDPRTGQWRAAGHLPAVRSDPVLALQPSGDLIAFGGTAPPGVSHTPLAARYRPSTDRWAALNIGMPPTLAAPAPPPLAGPRPTYTGPEPAQTASAVAYYATQAALPRGATPTLPPTPTPTRKPPPTATAIPVVPPTPSGPLPTGTLALRFVPPLVGFAQDERPLALRPSPTGVWCLASSTRQGGTASARLWDPSGIVRVTIAVPGPVGTTFAAAAFAPDGRTVALGVRSAGRPGQVTLFRLPDNDTDPVITIAGPLVIDATATTGAPRLAWSPDGTILAAADGEVLRLYTPTGLPLPGDGYRVPDLGRGRAQISALTWTLDGGRLTYGTQAGVLADVPRAALGLPAQGQSVNTPARLLGDLGAPAEQLAWSADGRALVATGARGAVFVAPDWSDHSRLWWFPPGSDAPVLNVIPDGVEVTAGAWSDTGELALVGPPGHRWLWSPSTP